MAEFSPGLPANFDPEQHEQPTERLAEMLQEGVTVLAVTVAKRSTSGATDAPTIRCWDCYKQPDGNYDCFSVPCPPSWPPLPQVEKAKG